MFNVTLTSKCKLSLSLFKDKTSQCNDTVPRRLSQFKNCHDIKCLKCMMGIKWDIELHIQLEQQQQHISLKEPLPQPCQLRCHIHAQYVLV